MDSHRHQRISESVREELEELINYELTDPRIGQVSISDLQLSPDVRQARVMLVLGGSAAEQAQTLEAVEHAKQFLRHQLAERLQINRTPDLHFEAALPAALGAKTRPLLRRIRRGRPKDAESSNNSED